MILKVWKNNYFMEKVIKTTFIKKWKKYAGNTAVFDFHFWSHLNQCRLSQNCQGDGYAEWNNVFSTEKVQY